MFDFSELNGDIKSVLSRLANERVLCERCGAVMGVYAGEGLTSIIYQCPSCGYCTEIGYGFKRRFYRQCGYKRFVDTVSKYPVDVVKAYRTLGLEIGASLDDVNSAFRSLSKKWHPDINPSENAEEIFKKINEAREILINYLSK